jgi:hypothetical protein
MAVNLCWQPLPLEATEDSGGKAVISYDYLNDLCRTAHPTPERRYG